MKYEEQEISIKELFESGLTNEGSIHALYRRAAEGLLFQIGRKGRTRLYDKNLSVILLKAVRYLYRPGLSLREIVSAVHEANISREQIINLIVNQNYDTNTAIKYVSNLIEKYLRADYDIKDESLFEANELQDSSILLSFLENNIKFDVWIEPGEANKEDLCEIYLSLSELYRAYGGIGLSFFDDKIEVLRFEEGLA